MARITENYLREQLENNKYNLLGQIDISDSEYAELLEFGKILIRNMSIQTIIPADLRLSVLLVQIAIRHYQEGNFWKNVQSELGSLYSKENYLGKIFYQTIKRYHLLVLPENGRSIQYVENIKAHSFVPNHYMNGFFEFSYAFFENNLFRSLADNLDDDIYDLSQFMLSTLDNDKDIIKTGNGAHAAKSYKLLKCTRSAMAFCSTETLKQLFMPALRLVDHYFYDGIVPTNPKSRYEHGLIEWHNANLQSNTGRNPEEKSLARRLSSRKPYIHIIPGRHRAELIIPPQKFRKSECSGIVDANVTIKSHTETFSLELYESFGIYISEQISIPIPEIFSRIDVTLSYDESEKTFSIPKQQYRILNTHWENISRFALGSNYLLTKPNTEVRFESDEDLIEDAYFDNWDFYSVSIRENSICYVEQKPLSIIGEFSFKPIYESLIEYMTFHDSKGHRIDVTKDHPTISFVVKKNRINGTVLKINNEKYPIEAISHRVSCDWPGDKTKSSISIDLSGLLFPIDDYYTVSLDIPGEAPKKLCSYLLLTKFSCKFNKTRYTYQPTAELRIRHSGHSVSTLDESLRLISEDEGHLVYEIPLNAERSQVEFIVDIGQPFTLTLPLKLFLYGFSQDNMMYGRDELWYSELNSNLYIKLPGASEVSAYYGKNSDVTYPGIQLDDQLFFIDISDIISTIKSSNQPWHYINIQFTDNMRRKTSLPCIYRSIIVKPEDLALKWNGDCLYMEMNYPVYADLEMIIEDNKSHETIDRIKINRGVTLLPMLDKQRAYDFHPIMLEEDEFGFDVTEMHLKSYKKIGYIDPTNYVGCKLPVECVRYENTILNCKGDYFLYPTEKADENTYIGNLSVKEKNKFGDYIKGSSRHICQIRFILHQEDNMLTAEIECFVKEGSDEYMDFMYYDKLLQNVIHSQSTVMKASKNYARFIMLDGSNFVINKEKIKRS